MTFNQCHNLTVLEPQIRSPSQCPGIARFTTGESILTEISQCLKLVTLAANQCNKNDAIARAKGSESLGHLRVSIEVIRSYLLVAWQLKLLSHGGLHELTGVLESVSKQAARWQQWFYGRNAEATS